MRILLIMIKEIGLFAFCILSAIILEWDITFPLFFFLFMQVPILIEDY